jgi:hypothetical protein
MGRDTGRGIGRDTERGCIDNARHGLENRRFSDREEVTS